MDDHVVCKPSSKVSPRWSIVNNGCASYGHPLNSHGRKLKSLYFQLCHCHLSILTGLASPFPASLVHSCLQSLPHSCPMKTTLEFSEQIALCAAIPTLPLMVDGQTARALELNLSVPGPESPPLVVFTSRRP